VHSNFAVKKTRHFRSAASVAAQCRLRCAPEFCRIGRFVVIRRQFRPESLELGELLAETIEHGRDRRSSSDGITWSD
jgi:hypothetical protein